MGKETTLFIDPSLLGENELEQVAEIIAKYPDSKVFVFLSRFQKEDLSKKSLNPIICLGLDWPFKARSDAMVRIIHYLDTLEDLPEAHFFPWQQVFQYRLNVPKLYRFFFAKEGRMFFTIATLLCEHATKWSNSNFVAIGCEDIFFSAIESIAPFFDGQLLSKHIIRRKEKKRLHLAYSRTQTLLRMLKNEFTLCWPGKGHRKFIYVDTHRQTGAVVQAIRDYSDIAVFQNIISPMQKMFFKPAFYRQAGKAANECSRLMGRFFQNNPFQEDTVPWMAILKAFVQLLELRLANIMYQTFQIWKYFNRVNPVGIVCINWLGHTHQAMRAWGKANRIPFFVIQHGIHSGGVVSPIEARIDADHFFCWGPGMRDSFIKADPANARVLTCTGNPCYDRRFGVNSPYENGKLSFKGTVSILVAPSERGYMMLDADIEFWREIKSVANTFQNINWIIRCHSLFVFKEQFNRYFKGMGFAVSDSQKDSILDSIRQCHLVITTISSVTLDAMIMKRPVIIINNTKIPELFSKYGAGICIEETGKLKDIVSKLYHKSFQDEELISRQNAFVDLFSSQDGVKNILGEIRAHIR